MSRREAVGNREAAWQRFDQANGIDAFLPSAETGSPWTQFSFVRGKFAAKSLRKELRKHVDRILRQR